jgi:hypothetical protein
MNKKDIKVGMVVEVTGYKGQLFVIEEEIVPGVYTASTTILDYEIKKPKINKVTKNGKEQRNENDPH